MKSKEVTEEQLMALRVAASDKPAHARFLERCIAAVEQGGQDALDMVHVEPTSTLSWQAGSDILGDVYIAFGWSQTHMEYAKRRREYEARAASRRRTMGTAEYGLSNLMKF